VDLHAKAEASRPAVDAAAEVSYQRRVLAAIAQLHAAALTRAVMISSSEPGAQPAVPAEQLRAARKLTPKRNGVVQRAPSSVRQTADEAARQAPDVADVAAKPDRDAMREETQAAGLSAVRAAIPHAADAEAIAK
jgi:hypothetical protein